MLHEYAWHYPSQNGMPVPAPTPEATAAWAVAELPAACEPGSHIIAHPRDVPALRATILAERIVQGSAATGLPQAGTVWLEAAHA